MNVGFSFGALAPDITAQAEEQGLTLKRGEFFNESKRSLNLLRINEIISDSEYDRACKRMLKLICKNILKKQEAKGE